MTETEQKLIDLLVKRTGYLAERHPVRKKLAAVNRAVAARVNAGDVDGLNNNWYRDTYLKEPGEGDPNLIHNNYSTDESLALQEEYEDIIGWISSINASLRYYSKKLVKQQTTLATEIFKEKTNV